MNELDGKLCIVTGASSGIGLVSARELARRGAHVAIVCRNREKGERTRDIVGGASASGAVDLLLADLSSQAEIRRLAEEILARYDAIHVLLNNAGVTELRRSTTVDGLETVFAVNHLAYFLLTNLLLERILTTPGARIVNVASEGHKLGRLDLDDLNSEKDRYRWMRVYGTSKLANVLFTYELARRLEGTGVTVNCLHPGAVKTGLGSSSSPILHRVVMTALGPLFRTPEKGAETSIYLATSKDVAGVSGKYFRNCRAVASSASSHDAALARGLWEASERLTGISPAP